MCAPEEEEDGGERVRRTAKGRRRMGNGREGGQRSPPQFAQLKGDAAVGETVGGNASAAPPPSPAPAWRYTMGIQETAAMVVAYSASCGIALVDDASLSAVCRRALNTLEEMNSARRDVEAGGEDRIPAVISPQELRRNRLSSTT